MYLWLMPFCDCIVYNDEYFVVLIILCTQYKLIYNKCNRNVFIKFRWSFCYIVHILSTISYNNMRRKVFDLK